MENDEIKTIVLSELSPQQKELYLSFLVEKNVVFARDVDGNYIAHVVVQPSVSPAPTLAVPSSSFRSPMSPLALASKSAPAIEYPAAESPSTPRLRRQFSVSSPSSHSSKYAKMCALIGDVGAQTARQRPLPWLLKIIDSVYEAYLRREDADPTWHVSADPSVRASRLLSVFTVQYVTKLHGLRHIVEQMCWDIVYNVELYRNDYADVDLFAEFLADKLNFDDLLFFLRARVVLFAFAGSRRPTVEKAPQPLTQRQCTEAAEAIFSAVGADSGLDLLPPFLAALDTLLAARRRKTIDVSEFLRLSVLHYHAAVPPPAASTANVVADRHRTAALRSNYEDSVRRAKTELEQRLAVFEDMRRQSQAALDADRQTELHRTDVLQSVRRAMADRGLVDESTPARTALSELKAQTIAHSVVAAAMRPRVFDSAVSHDSISEEYARFAPKKLQQQQQQTASVAAEASALFPSTSFAARRLIADGGRPWEWDTHPTDTTTTTDIHAPTATAVAAVSSLAAEADGPPASAVASAGTTAAAADVAAGSGLSRQLAAPAAELAALTLTAAPTAATKATAAVDVVEFHATASVLTPADIQSLRESVTAAVTAVTNSSSASPQQAAVTMSVTVPSTTTTTAGAPVASGGAAVTSEDELNYIDTDVWQHISLPAQTVSLLRQTADSYISVLLRAADNVPTDVQDDIRAIASQHTAMSVATLCVSGRASQMLQQAPDIAAGCRMIIASPDVREAVEPLVALLVLQSQQEGVAPPADADDV